MMVSKIKILVKHKVYKDLVLNVLNISDLDWIQTSNLLSRNQVRYSVSPRGRFEGANILFFTYLQTIFCHKISPANYCHLPFFGFCHVQSFFGKAWEQNFIEIS